MIDISFSRLPVMRNRFARGAMLIILALAVAFVAYRFVLYNSPEAKQARFRASIEKEIAAVEVKIDSLNKLYDACAKVDPSLKRGTKEYFKQYVDRKRVEKCRILAPRPFLRKRDSLRSLIGKGIFVPDSELDSLNPASRDSISLYNLRKAGIF